MTVRKLTRVVHVREPHDVYCGRPSKWGNPYVIGRNGTRDEVIEKFIRLRSRNEAFKESIRRELAGKRIACFCSPHRCHLDWVAKVANGEIR